MGSSLSCFSSSASVSEVNTDHKSSHEIESRKGVHQLDLATYSSICKNREPFNEESSVSCLNLPVVYSLSV